MRLQHSAGCDASVTACTRHVEKRSIIVAPCHFRSPTSKLGWQFAWPCHAFFGLQRHFTTDASERNGHLSFFEIGFRSSYCNRRREQIHVRGQNVWFPKALFETMPFGFRIQQKAIYYFRQLEYDELNAGWMGRSHASDLREISNALERVNSIHTRNLFSGPGAQGRCLHTLTERLREKGDCYTG